MFVAEGGKSLGLSKRFESAAGRHTDTPERVLGKCTCGTAALHRCKGLAKGTCFVSCFENTRIYLQGVSAFFPLKGEML